MPEKEMAIKKPWEQGYVVSGIYDHFIGLRY